MELKEKLLSTGYFIENEYFQKYLELITSNNCSVKEQFRTNNHHIIPVHYFINTKQKVDNSKANIVTLYFKDHLLAHLYLSGCTKGRYRYWNLYSLFLMSGHTFSVEDEEAVRCIYERNDYSVLYEEAIEAAPNHRKGIKVSEETLTRMRDAARKRILQYGSPTKGRRWVHKDLKDYMVPADEVEMYLQEGFELGRLFKHSIEAKRKCAKASETRKQNGSYTSPEYIKKLSEANTGKTHSLESIKRQRGSIKKYYETHSGTFLGKAHSEEAKNKNRLAHLGKLTINRDGVIKMIDSIELDNYLSDGWKRGRK